MSSSDNANSAPTSPDALVLQDISDGVATLTLNRPDKLNALTPELLDILDEHLAGLEQSKTVHCLVLTGAGRSFCAGHDLDALDEQPGQAEREAAIIDRLENFPAQRSSRSAATASPAASNSHSPATCWWPPSPRNWPTPIRNGGSFPSGACQYAYRSESATRKRRNSPSPG